MTLLAKPRHAILATLCLGTSLAAVEALAGESRLAVTVGSACSEAFTELQGFELITSRTGQFSPTTGEMIVGPSMFLRAHFEGFDGVGPQGLEPNPRNMLIFTTASGRFVVRFLDWPGAH